MTENFRGFSQFPLAGEIVPQIRALPFRHFCNLLLSIVLPLKFGSELLKFWDKNN